MRGAATGGLTAAFGAAGAAALAGIAALAGVAGFGAAAVLGAIFEAVVFEPVAFAAVLADLSGITLLLLFEDFAAATLRASFGETLARPLGALRATTAAFFDVLEALFLRVFCDTACARKLPRPCSMFHGTQRGQRVHMA